MQVKKTNVSSRRLSSEIDLFEGRNLPSSVKDDIKDEVGDYLKEQILSSIGDLKSPIAGQGWPKLSKEYAKDKQARGFVPAPNLEVSGELLNSLDVKPTTKGIEIGVFGSAAERADGHNNFSGKSKIPTRRFLPEVGQKFKGDIQKEIDKIINDKIAQETAEITRSKFGVVKTREEFWLKLREEFPEFSRGEIVDVISRSQEYSRILAEFNLLRWLSPE